VYFPKLSNKRFARDCAGQAQHKPELPAWSLRDCGDECILQASLVGGSQWCASQPNENLFLRVARPKDPRINLKEDDPGLDRGTVTARYRLDQLKE
jgi:hypothetical protein